MSDVDVKKLRGLKALVQDAVVNGAARIEEIHKATAARSFQVLESIPAVAAPTQVVRAVHDAIVTSGYAATRTVTEVLGAGIDAALDVVEANADATDGGTPGEHGDAGDHGEQGT